MTRWFFSGVIIEIALIAVFGFVVKTEWVFLGKILIAMMTVLAFGAIFFLAARRHRLKRLCILAILLGATAALSVQVLGFTRFPGFVKDLAPFSSEQLTNTVILFCLATCFLLAEMAVAVFLRHFFLKAEDQPF